MDRSGRETKGAILDLSVSSMVIRVSNAPQKYPADTVKTIRWQQPDSLKNGALIGLGVGVGFALVMSAGCGSDYAACALGTGLIFGGIGTAIGVGVDALTPGKNVLVYSAASQSPAARVSIAPILTPKRQGVMVRVSF
jgi:hypothetical protein